MTTKTTSPSTSVSHEVRRAGVAGLTAATLFVLTTVVTQVAPVGTEYESVSDRLHQVVLALAYVLVVVTLLGLHVRQRASQRYGRLGSLGTILTVIGYGGVLVVVVTGIAVGSRVFNEARLVAAVVLLVGSVLLGAATLRARVMPWWCGVLLIVAFPLGDVADQVYSGGEGLVLAGLWGAIGAALLRPPGSGGAASRG